MSRSSAFGLVALLSLSGCFGTETGNPPFAPSVAADHGVPMGIVPQATLQEGWLALASVAFEGCDGGDAIVVRSAPAALALEGEQSLETEPVLDEGDYCALRLSRVVWTEGAPAALEGSTLAIDAALSDGTPVRIRSTTAGTIRLSGEPFEMSADAGALLVFVDESLLFNALSFNDAVREADRSIVIDADTNAALLDRIEEQLPGSLFLYRDADADGRLGAEERAAGPLATYVP